MTKERTMVPLAGPANKQARILGAQIVGQDGVDKRIDTLAAAMRFNGTI